MEHIFEIIALSKPDLMQPNKTKSTQAKLNNFDDYHLLGNDTVWLL
jgi:hypothetical protein